MQYFDDKPTASLRIYQGTSLVVIDPQMLMMRCFSTRLAHFAQFERFSTTPWYQPSDCSARRREGTAQACARHARRPPPLPPSGPGESAGPPTTWGAHRLEHGGAPYGR